VGRARGAVSPDFSAKRPLPDPRALLANWWKGRDSNPRPRHYELAAPLKIGSNVNNLPKDVPLRLARRSTTEHSRFPQISRIFPGSVSKLRRQAALPWRGIIATLGRRAADAPHQLPEFLLRPQGSEGGLAGQLDQHADVCLTVDLKGDTISRTPGPTAAASQYERELPTQSAPKTQPRSPTEATEGRRNTTA